LAGFNRDGKLDLAVANSESNNVTILLGDGGGAFRPAAGSPFAAGHSPSDIVVGDVNKDSNLDLAFANHDTNYLTVLNGDGKDSS
jgi:FG-GAP-like repeat